jgi:hypothetical protein
LELEGLLRAGSPVLREELQGFKGLRVVGGEGLVMDQVLKAYYVLRGL